MAVVKKSLSKTPALIQKEKEGLVIKYSNRYGRAKLILNKQSENAFVWPKSWKIRKSVDSLDKFHRFDYDKCLEETILFRPDKFRPLVDAYYGDKGSLKRIQSLRAYSGDDLKRSKADYAHDEIMSLMGFDEYLEIEQRLCDDLLSGLNNDCSFTFIIKCTYDSPACRNHYEDCRVYSMREVSSVFVDIIDRLVSGKVFVKKERNKATPSLRYEVMRRDDFKCTLCGRGVDDGVRLEVDHIIPVSCGGKTEMCNLRTLCFDCNRGKGSMFEKESIK